METEFWMSKLTHDYSELPINKIAIPGSHDSFTCQITSSSEIGPDVRSSALKLMKSLGYYGKWFMRDWLITQDQNVTQQLLKGVRYFDLRIGKSTTDLCVTHQLFSGAIDGYLRDIDRYLVEHRKEVVLLDFNHIYLDESDHKALISLIIEIFGEKVAPHSEYRGIPSLSELWSRHQQVLVFYHNFSQSSYKFWPAATIPTYWPNTTSVQVMIDFLNDALKHKDERKFHISQGILTPGAWTLTLHPFSTLRSYLADRATAEVARWLSTELAGPAKSVINIVIVDFVQDHNFIESVLKLNVPD